MYGIACADACQTYSTDKVQLTVEGQPLKAEDSWTSPAVIAAVPTHQHANHNEKGPGVGGAATLVLVHVDEAI
jgi:hypothetical protein